ncbi:MAG TPA: glycerophosphodiester phosphodiesterase [archaeon]|nr:glycerophosphodiester phosphodiesterase [archaeon]
MKSPIIWGHRGAGFTNTLPSYKKCVDLGVDGLKTEARLSKDGVVILRFKPSIIIDGKRKLIKESNLEVIKQVILENNEEIPSLNEMFDAFNDKIRYNFDIWDVETGIKIIDVAKQYDLLEKIEITKPAGYRDPFHTLLKPLRKKDNDVILMNSLFSEKQITEDKYELLDHMRTLNIQVVNLSHHRFNMGIFKLVKKFGFKFYVWGVLFKYFLKKFITLNYKGMGIDGIYSHHPDKAVKLKRKYQSS